MDTNVQVITAEQLAQAFDKIYEGLDKQRVVRMEEELAKMVPSPQSVVSLSSGYDEQRNYISVAIFVNNPLKNIKPQEVVFNQVIRKMLYHADVSKFRVVSDCIKLMEQKEGNYDIDGIPADYDSEENEYYINISIAKR